MNGVVNIDDLRKLAKRRLPKIAYDFIEGGLEDEDGIARNASAFRQYRLVPRYGVDVTARDQSATIFGKTYSSPVGIAPTGLIGLFRRGGDMMLAQAAKAELLLNGLDGVNFAADPIDSTSLRWSHPGLQWGSETAFWPTVAVWTRPNACDSHTPTLRFATRSNRNSMANTSFRGQQAPIKWASRMITRQDNAGYPLFGGILV